MIQSHLTDPPNQTSPHLLPMLCFYCIFLPTNSSTLYCEIVADLVVIEIIGEEGCRDGELPTEAGVEGF